MKDQIYQQPMDRIAGFVFDETVAAVFPDMIQRSVPGYSTIIAMTGVLAARFATPGSTCYDLGCSLGASTLSMAQEIRKRGTADVRFVAIDNSTAMIARCNDAARRLVPEQAPSIQWQCANIQDVDYQNASVVVLNFSLQFVPLAERSALLTRLYRGMVPGGVLVLSEKICFDDEQLNQLNIDLHHEFKRANGYSDLEISQKRTALENVLIPETLPAHQDRLRAAGFRSCDTWFQCFNFASLVAIK